MSRKELEQTEPFPSTSWTLLMRADGDVEALSKLVWAYWRPIFAFVRAGGCAVQDAEDITQSFIAEVIIGRGLFGRADPARGRFRSYLKAALRNFIVDWARSERKHQAARYMGFKLDLRDTSSADPLLQESAEAAFDRLWATTAINLALEQLECELKTGGRVAHWAVFHERIVAPSRTDVAAGTFEQIADKLDLESASKASRMLHSAKRRFRSLLRRVVTQTVENPGDLDGELAELMKLIGNDSANQRQRE